MSNRVTEKIQNIAGKLSENYTEQNMFDLALGGKFPSREVVISIIEELQKLTFPGFYGSANMALVSKENFAGNKLATLYEKVYKQIKTALVYDNPDKPYEELKALAIDKALQFLEQIPLVQNMLLKDVDAAFNGDPAAKNKEDIILSYPGVYAIMTYRYAHELYKLDVPYVPRIMTEHAHSKTGIDINPGATIGEYFCIDHGTGIVIGETTVIGNHVKIYQGVTLGALSTRKGQGLAGVKRHPTIKDNVIIYSNASILGGETVVGENAVVAGNTFVTTSIPANAKAMSLQPQLEIRES